MTDRSSGGSGITVGTLIDLIKGYPKDKEICFGGSNEFTFSRVKNRGTVLQIEFNEALGLDYQMLKGDDTKTD